MRYYLYSYNMFSKGCEALARALGIKRIRRERSRFRGSQRKTVINWGSSNPERYGEIMNCHIINHPSAVAICSNKLEFFRTVGEHCSVPEWTENIQVVRDWLEDGHVACARQSLTGSCGAGLVVIRDSSQLVEAPLYTKYTPKTDEYRIHVVAGKVIDVQRKALRNGTAQPNWQVRNSANGFVYVRQGVTPPACVKEEALKAVAAVPELVFGAVDVIYNQRRDKAYVLEINTAPGIEGTTVTKYAESFKEIMNGPWS